jgi:hypothetical protein
MTVLVLDLRAPSSHHAALLASLVDQWPAYVSFLASFLYIAVIWTNHDATFRWIASTDRSLTWANLGILCGTVLLPFPTAARAFHASERRRRRDVDAAGFAWMRSPAPTPAGRLQGTTSSTDRRRASGGVQTLPTRPERSSRSPALRRLLHPSPRDRGGLAARRDRATSERLHRVLPRERGSDARGAIHARRHCMAAPSLRAARYSTGPSHDQCGRVRSSGTNSGRS